VLFAGVRPEVGDLHVVGLDLQRTGRLVRGGDRLLQPSL
jgi:hypothetical protein